MPIFNSVKQRISFLATAHATGCDVRSDYFSGRGGYSATAVYHFRSSGLANAHISSHALFRLEDLSTDWDVNRVAGAVSNDDSTGQGRGRECWQNDVQLLFRFLPSLAFKMRRQVGQDSSSFFLG